MGRAIYDQITISIAVQEFLVANGHLERGAQSFGFSRREQLPGYVRQNHRVSRLFHYDGDGGVPDACGPVFVGAAVNVVRHVDQAQVFVVGGADKSLDHHFGRLGHVRHLK